MLDCVPRSIFSWSFDVTGSASGAGELTFDFFTEQGTISLGGDRFEVVKHGPFSGKWTLEAKGEVLAEAVKHHAFTRRFDVTADGLNLELSAESPFGRAFAITRGDEVLGRIAPAGLFTRRARVECAPHVSDTAQLFLTWLALLMWKRAAASSSQ